MAPPHTSAVVRSSPLARDWLAGLFFAHLLARWLVPAEATAQGETLWIAQGWFVAGACVFCFSSPLAPVSGERVRERGGAFQSAATFDFADIAIGLLIGGHVISGIVVVINGGDRRAAVNLLWEWLSLGVFWCLARALLSRPEIRRQLVPFLMTTALTLSTWGLWQHFVWYPQMAATFGPLLEQWRDGNRNPEIQRQLVEAGIPLDGPSLELFINRLVQSREPFGPFALANTYGGLLAAWLVIGIFSILRDASQKRSLSVRSSAWLSLTLIGFSLCLTNSRTAWAGLLAAIAAGGVIWMAGNATSTSVRRWLFPVAVLGGMIAGLGVLWTILGDEHAVPGPLKSLVYRVEYWMGTMRMLLASPWLGTGLGQFQDRYPKFKIPESSEEIADPHNLLLDVWANGGLIAVAGLLGIVAWLLVRLHFSQSPPSAPAGPIAPLSMMWRFAGVAGFLLAITASVLTTDLWDDSTDQLAVFGAVWFTLSWLTPRCFSNGEDHGSFALLAALALAVHLLGAGGIGMPAVTQLLLFLLAWGAPTAAKSDEVSPSRFTRWFASTTCAALAAGCFFTACKPSVLVMRYLQTGERTWLHQNLDAAERNFRMAATADSLSPAPWLRLAELEFSRRNQDAAMKAIDAAINLSPQRASLWQKKGRMAAEFARQDRRGDMWQAAIAAYQAAVQRHPTDVLLLADYAQALSHVESDQAASEAARRAIEQDNLNRRRGHTDQFLPERRLRELERLAKAE